MENWLERYKPKKISEIVGNKSYINGVDEFISQFKENSEMNNPNLIITGPNGIGKTLITDLTIAKNGMMKISMDLSGITLTRKTKKSSKDSAIKQNKSIKVYYNSLCNGRFSFNGVIGRRKVVLVIDDVTNISNPKEKEAIKALVKINCKYRKIPIIIIANTKHSKTLGILKKSTGYNVVGPEDANGKNKKVKLFNEIIMKRPSYEEIEKITKKICSAENINLITKRDDTGNLMGEVINHCQNDIRRLIIILEELYSIYGKNITYSDFEKYLDSSKKKDIDPGIFEATRTLLNQYTNINDALFLYGDERSAIPLMVHENYPLNIRTQYPKLTPLEKLDLMCEISKSISESDKIDGLIYSNQCWNLQPVHGFYSCAVPSYHINKNPRKMNNYEIYRYTQDYNKTSIKQINNKVIKRAQEHQTLKKATVYDFLYMSHILKRLLDQKKYEELCTLMSPYKLHLKEIESIIKIDKINKTKSVLTNSQKNILKGMI